MVAKNSKGSPLEYFTMNMEHLTTIHCLVTLGNGNLEASRNRRNTTTSLCRSSAEFTGYEPFALERAMSTYDEIPTYGSIASEFAAGSEQALLFGKFCLLARQRLLLEDGKSVRVGCRALDILIALVRNRGLLVTKRTLMSTVWPDTSVVEANLTVNVAGLRRVLKDGRAGNRYIVNVVGRGYCFVAPVCYADIASLPPIGTTSRPNVDALESVGA